MIRITRRNDTINIQGHAGYAEHGKDIVCASISTLAQTLVHSLDILTNDEIVFDIDEQSATIDIKLWTLSERAQVLIESFFIGVEGVRLAFPDFVQIDQA